MRHFILFRNVFLVTSTILFAGCQKQIGNQQKEIQSVSLSSPGGSCRAVGLGLFTVDPQNNPVWQNLMLKWYDDSGKLKYVKFRLDWNSGYGIDLDGRYIDDLAVDYGEVTYNNDEVHLRDVNSNVEILKVKLDANNRPLISWYYNPNSHSGFSWPRDTSYYSYSPSGRLESVVQHKSGLDGRFPNFVIDWKFIYDPDGNLVEISAPEPYGAYYFRYDYTQLNHGMVTLNIFTAPTKMLEFMDLLKFEQHHQLSQVLAYAGGGIRIHEWDYERLTRDNEGRVTSYSQDYIVNRWYTAWDCSGNSMLQTKNPTRDEFMKMAH